MKNLFTYYSGSLDEFISTARSIRDNHLIKIQLAPSSLPEYLDYTKDINDYTYSLIEEIRNGHSELATTTLYKKKKKLTDAKSPI